MCVRLCKDEEYSKEGFWCFGGATIAAMEQLATFRNERTYVPVSLDEGAGKHKEAGKGEPVPQGCCDLFTRRALAEVGFALLAVAGVVESVVRVILALITLIPCALISLCGLECGKDDKGDQVAFLVPIALFLEGVIGIVDLPLRGLVALVKNVSAKEFKFNDLTLCELVNCQEIMK